MTRKVLIIDDVPVSAQMAPYLDPFGFVLEQVATVGEAQNKILEFEPDLILLDLHFDDDEVGASITTGGSFHTTLRQRFPQIPIVIFSTRPGDNSIPAETFEIRPLAILSKPDLESNDWQEDFAARLDRAILSHARTSEEYTEELSFPVGKTKGMLEFARRLSLAAPTSRSVLLRGEAGTGKEMAARAVHNASACNGRFVAARIAALPPDLVLPALFGHTRDSVPNVGEPSDGLLVSAAGGTLFIDEVRDLTPEAQAALVAYLNKQDQSGPGNSDSPREVARIVAATQHDLNDLVRAGSLRRDLKDRLSEVDLTLTPLRERVEDIPYFFTSSVRKFNHGASVSVSEQLRPETLEKLCQYTWPGNVREFDNVLQSAMLWTQNEILMPEDIVFDMVVLREPESAEADDQPTPVEMELHGIVDFLFQQLDKTAEGDQRYKYYKEEIPKNMLLAINEKIFSELQKIIIDRRLQQIDLSNYLFGKKNTQTTADRVRGYVSTNKAWPTNR